MALSLSIRDPRAAGRFCVSHALAQRLTVELACSSSVLAGHRGERDKLDRVYLDLTETDPVAAALLDPWTLPESDRRA